MLFVLGESASLSLSLSPLSLLPSTSHHHHHYYYTRRRRRRRRLPLFAAAPKRRRRKKTNFLFFLFYSARLSSMTPRCCCGCRRIPPSATGCESECVQQQQQQSFNGREKLNNACTHTRSYQCHTFAKSLQQKRKIQTRSFLFSWRVRRLCTTASATGAF